MRSLLPRKGTEFLCRQLPALWVSSWGNSPSLWAPTWLEVPDPTRRSTCPVFRSQKSKLLNINQGLDLMFFFVLIQVNLLRNKFGFDDAFNYKKEADLDAALKR